MDKSTFGELLNIMREDLNEELYIKYKSENSYAIIDNGLNANVEEFTQIDFRIENDIFIIPWFYLSKQNKGIGSKIMIWIIEFCINNNINSIEVRNVKRDKQGMKSLLNKFDFQIVKSSEYMNFRKVL